MDKLENYWYCASGNPLLSSGCRGRNNLSGRWRGNRSYFKWVGSVPHAGHNLPLTPTVLIWQPRPEPRATSICNKDLTVWLGLEKASQVGVRIPCYSWPRTLLVVVVPSCGWDSDWVHLRLVQTPGFWGKCPNYITLSWRIQSNWKWNSGFGGFFHSFSFEVPPLCWVTGGEGEGGSKFSAFVVQVNKTETNKLPVRAELGYSPQRTDSELSYFSYCSC